MIGFVRVGDEPVVIPREVITLVDRLVSETADMERSRRTRLQAGADMLQQRQAKTLDDLAEAIAHAMVAYSNSQQEVLSAEIHETLNGLLDARKALDLGIDLVQERVKALDKDRSKGK